MGFGVGMYLVHRRRPFAWLFVATAALITVLDHARANAWGGGRELLDLLFVYGHLIAALIMVAVVTAIGHDLYVQRWASTRDRLFPGVTLRYHLATMQEPSLTVWERFRRLLAETHYRRYRLAAFIDLFRVRSRSEAAGDRTDVVGALTGLATTAGLWIPGAGWRPSSPQRGDAPGPPSGEAPTATAPAPSWPPSSSPQAPRS